MKYFSPMRLFVLSSCASFVFSFDFRGARRNLREIEDVDFVRDLIGDIDGEAHYQIAESCGEISAEINNLLLEANPDLDEDELTYARAFFVEYLDNGYNNQEDPLETRPSPDGEDDTVEETPILDQVNDERGGTQRGYPYYNKHYNKACRNAWGGKGSSHHDYYLYKNSSFSWCKSKCNSLGSHCYGFEYAKDGRCEVWKVPTKYVEGQHGFQCHVRMH